jgi:hypothetical protein
MNSLPAKSRRSLRQHRIPALRILRSNAPIVSKVVKRRITGNSIVILALTVATVILGGHKVLLSEEFPEAILQNRSLL